MLSIDPKLTALTYLIAGKFKLQLPTGAFQQRPVHSALDCCGVGRECYTVFGSGSAGLKVILACSATDFLQMHGPAANNVP